MRELMRITSYYDPSKSLMAWMIDWLICYRCAGDLRWSGDASNVVHSAFDLAGWDLVELFL